MQILKYSQYFPLFKGFPPEPNQFNRVLAFNLNMQAFLCFYGGLILQKTHILAICASFLNNISTQVTINPYVKSLFIYHKKIYILVSVANNYSLFKQRLSLLPFIILQINNTCLIGVYIFNNVSLYPSSQDPFFVTKVIHLKSEQK